MAACPDHTTGTRAPNPSEEKARAALEVTYGIPLSDAEWQRVRTRLLDFVKLLRVWEVQCRRTS